MQFIENQINYTMKTKILAVIIALIFSHSAYPQDEKMSNRVLFLGNSVFFSHGGIYQSFLGFCNTGGIDCRAISQRREPQHTHGVEFLRVGRIPTNLPDFAADEKFLSVIREGGFDYVIIEARREGHLLPEWVDRSNNIPGWVKRFIDYDPGEHIPYEKNIAALEKLHRTITESGAQTVLYMHPGLYYTPEWKNPLAQMYERFRDDLEAVTINGTTHEVILVPASLMWRDAVNRYGADNWYADHIHGNAMARYASGCMVYTYLTGDDPRNNSFRQLPKHWVIPPDTESEYVSMEDAEWIKKQVWFYYSTGRR